MKRSETAANNFPLCCEWPAFHEASRHPVVYKCVKKFILCGERICRQMPSIFRPRSTSGQRKLKPGFLYFIHTHILWFAGWRNNLLKNNFPYSVRSFNIFLLLIVFYHLYFICIMQSPITGSNWASGHLKRLEYENKATQMSFVHKKYTTCSMVPESNVVLMTPSGCTQAGIVQAFEELNNSPIQVVQVPRWPHELLSLHACKERSIMG